MKTPNKRLIGLIAISIIQLVFPLFFIFAKEHVIETGKEYLFSMQPIDPYDFFQGRYVSLNVPPLTYSTTNHGDLKRNDIVYAEFEQDTAGVIVKNLSHQKSKYSLKLKLYEEPGRAAIRIRLPFNRFYLEENKAKSIEERLARNSDHANFIHVRILNGDFVMTDISSNGKSLITGKAVQSPALTQSN